MRTGVLGRTGRGDPGDHRVTALDLTHQVLPVERLSAVVHGEGMVGQAALLVQKGRVTTEHIDQVLQAPLLRGSTDVAVDGAAFAAAAQNAALILAVDESRVALVLEHHLGHGQPRLVRVLLVDRHDVQRPGASQGRQRQTGEEEADNHTEHEHLLRHVKCSHRVPQPAMVPVYCAQMRKRAPVTSWGRRTARWLHNHLLPHQGNNHQPHALRHGALFSYTTVLVMLKVFALSVSVALPGASLQSAAITAHNIVALTNQTRREANLNELTVDSKLAMAAQAKADHMLTEGYFAHVSPNGRTPWYWFEQYGYTYRSAGENLAANFWSAEDVTSGWLASPTHHDNLVSNRFDEIGVGVAQGIYQGYPTTFVVQMFGYELGETEEAPTPIQEVVEPTVDALAINDAVTSVLPGNNSYKVAVYLSNAQQAMLRLNGVEMPLVKQDGELWQAEIPYNPESLAEEGDQLTLVASDAAGTHLIRNLAWVLPQAAAQDIYAPEGADRLPKLLGVVDIAHVNDGVTQFYLYVMVALSSLLFIALVLKFHQQNIRTVGHVAAVLCLALLLSLI